MYDGTKYNLGGLFISQCNNNTILCIDYQYVSLNTNTILFKRKGG